MTGKSDGERRARPHNTGNNEGLCELDSGLKSRYIAALESLGLSLPKDLPALHIDRTGYSPEVAEALGRDYLSGRLILLTEHQEHLSSIPREYSNLSDAAEHAFIEFRHLVVSVLPNEALIVSVKQTLASRGGSYDLTAFLESLGKSETPEVPLLKKGICTHETLLESSTTSNAAGLALSAVKTLDDISEKTIDDFLLGERRIELEKCARAISVLGRLYSMDDIRRLASASTASKVRLETPFRYRSDGADVVIDVVPAPEPFLVYSGENQQLAAADGKPFAVVHVSDTARLMGHLFTAGYLVLDPGSIRSRLHELGVAALCDADYSEGEIERAENDALMLYQELKKQEVRQHIPKEWFALREMGSMLKAKPDSAGMMDAEREKLAGLYQELSPDSKMAVSRASERARQSAVLSTFLGYWLPELEG